MPKIVTLPGDGIGPEVTAAAVEVLREVAPDVLRHRVLPSYEATAEGWDGDRLVAELIAKVPLP